MKKICIHQPYAVPPYRGYYRLFEKTDLAVLLDDAQFTRRGFMHRNRLRLADGRLDWFTLPLKKAPQETLIKDMRFADDAYERIQEQMRRFPCFQRLPDDLRLNIECAHGGFAEYAHRILALTARHLGIKTSFVQSQFSLVPRDMPAADRLIALCKHFGADSLLNAPGGVKLYDPAYFAERGVKLEFLPAWDGPVDSVLELIAAQQERVAA